MTRGRLVSDFARGSLFALLLVACERAPVAPPPPAPVPVRVIAAAQQDVPVHIEEIGQTRGSTEIEIRARVEGFLESVDFREGTPVAKGQLLYTIDRRPLQAALDKAQGDLAEAEAGFVKARQDVLRYEPLVRENAIAREVYETALAYEKAATANVAAVRAAKERAELDLSYTRILSPVDGLSGKTEVQPGNLVGRGQNTLLTKISTIDPIHVRFTISEQDYLQLARAFPERQQTPEEERPWLEMILSDGSAHLHKGKVIFSDRIVDPTTGTLLLEAAFPNPEHLLRPGQFCRVRCPVSVQTGAIVVPQRAVLERQATFNVAVVRSDQTIEIRPVQPGPRFGALWVIASGLRAGETVVVEGLQKVRAGVPVLASPWQPDAPADG